MAQCRVMVMVFSGDTNRSSHVHREISHAFKRSLTVIPVRIEETEASDRFQYYLDSVQWLNGFPPPVEQYLPRLVERVSRLLAKESVANTEKHRPFVEKNAPEPLDHGHRNLEVNVGGTGRLPTQRAGLAREHHASPGVPPPSSITTSPDDYSRTMDSAAIRAQLPALSAGGKCSEVGRGPRPLRR
jgi:hypothetical protein